MSIAREGIGVDGLHVAGRSLFDVRACAQFLQVYAFAHVGKFEAQRFAIDLIALLAAGIFSVVVRGHFCLSKPLVSREISEVARCFTFLPPVASAAGYFFLRSYPSRGLAGWSCLLCIIVHFIARRNGHMPGHLGPAGHQASPAAASLASTAAAS